jgi:ethanolamine utilization microcompartment shell protein EutL
VGGDKGEGEKKRCRTFPAGFVGLICLLLTAIFAAAASATEVSLPALKGKPGQTVEFPVMIDEAVKIAGVKLVIAYDKNLLTYREGHKTKETGPLMHIINDKNPGRIIVVMAGARGIVGKNFPLILLRFEIKKDAPTPSQTKLDITEIQLMGEDLKDIKSGVKAGVLTIDNSPAAPAKKGAGK